MNQYNVVLCIGGSDPSACAGIQADIKTISSLAAAGLNNVFAATAITAITVQNTRGVERSVSVDPDVVVAQMRAVLDDLPVRAVKIGMLGTDAIAHAVAVELQERALPVVVDPVMTSTTGFALSGRDAIATAFNELMPLSTVITPNIPEAEKMLQTTISTDAEARQAALELNRRFAHVAVLLKGGHASGDRAVDYLCLNQTITTIEAPRINSHNTRGTGCSLASAIAAGLAAGLSVEKACRMAKQYIYKAITSGVDYVLGHGDGPLAHNVKIDISEFL